MEKRKPAFLCAALLLAVFAVFGGLAEAADAAASVPRPEDYAGEYTCTTISFGDHTVPLDEETPYTLAIAGDEAVITGIKELGTDPLKLSFEGGEFFWIPPEEDARVFTLRLQEEGLVTLTLDGIPEAPVFRFDPAEPAR